MRSKTEGSPQVTYASNPFDRTSKRDAYMAFPPSPDSEWTSLAPTKRLCSPMANKKPSDKASSKFTVPRKLLSPQATNRRDQLSPPAPIRRKVTKYLPPPPKASSARAPARDLAGAQKQIADAFGNGKTALGMRRFTGCYYICIYIRLASSQQAHTRSSHCSNFESTVPTCIRPRGTPVGPTCSKS